MRNHYRKSVGWKFTTVVLIGNEGHIKEVSNLVDHVKVLDLALEGKHSVIATIIGLIHVVIANEIYVRDIEIKHMVDVLHKLNENLRAQYCVRIKRVAKINDKIRLLPFDELVEPGQKASS